MRQAIEGIRRGDGTEDEEGQTATIEKREQWQGLGTALSASGTPLRRKERIPVYFTESELRDLGKAARESRVTPETFLRVLWNRWCLEHDRRCVTNQALRPVPNEEGHAR